MRYMLLFSALLVSMTCSSRAGLKEKIVLVKETDRSKVESYRLMSSAEFKAAQKAIRNEKRLHMKAMTASTKEWKSDESNARRSFPTSAIAVRTIRAITTYTDSQKANDKLSYYSEKDARAAEKADKRKKDKGGKREKSDRAKERAAERKAMAREARQIYENALSELMQGDGDGE